MIGAASNQTDTSAATKPFGSQMAIDVVIVVVLIVTAYVTRRNGLPRDGLFFDDAWVATGVVRGSPSALLTAGSAHPGFTAGLMLWTRVLGDSATTFAVPALIAGTLGPAALFAMLRRLGFDRSISALLGAALVASSVHRLYSGRVKSYVVDVLIVIALVVIVPRLARVRWRWRLGAVWLVCAFLVGTFSGFALVATALAGVILVLHSSSDRLLRVAFVAMQGVLQLSLLLALQSRYNQANLEANQEVLYDGHLEFGGKPLRFLADAFVHFRRVLGVVASGPDWVLTVCAVIVLGGLVLGAMRKSVAGRFLLLLVLFAFVGAVAGIFPFGPWGGNPRSRGERSSLWLVPVLAVGLAIVLQRVRQVARTRQWSRTLFDSSVYLIAAVVVLAALQRDTVAYPFPGAASSTSYLEETLGAHDIALLTVTSVYSVAVEVKSPVTLRAQPNGEIGYYPEFGDRRLIPVGFPGFQLKQAIDRAQLVLVHIAITGFVGLRADYQKVLRDAGFVKQDTAYFGAASVDIWRRGSAAQ